MKTLEELEQEVSNIVLDCQEKRASNPRITNIWYDIPDVSLPLLNEYSAKYSIEPFKILSNMLGLQHSGAGYTLFIKSVPLKRKDSADVISEYEEV